MRRAGTRLPALALAALALVPLALARCGREKRAFQVTPAAMAAAARGPRAGETHVGSAGFRDSAGADTTGSVTTPALAAVGASYANQAFDLNEGKRLFDAYNCSGCHSHGGGGMGPAFLDRPWRYGSRPIDIYTTIVGGRPNGMPSFSGRIPQYQVWQLVAYVRSLSGHAAMTASPGRNDAMEVSPRPENSNFPPKPGYPESLPPYPHGTPGPAADTSR